MSTVFSFFYIQKQLSVSAAGVEEIQLRQDFPGTGKFNNQTHSIRN